MNILSPPPSISVSSARSAPPVFHGLMYGVIASVAMWGVIAVVASRFI